MKNKNTIIIIIISLLLSILNKYMYSDATIRSMSNQQQLLLFLTSQLLLCVGLFIQIR